MRIDKQHPFGSTLEALVYPSLLLVVLWLIYLFDQMLHLNLVRLGVLPRSLEGIKGIFLMPFIHSSTDIKHIINNSVPIFLLSATLIYFYREIALKVFVISWLVGGFGVWFFAMNKGAYHIGISGMIYSLAAFVFVSGVLRKYLPLQAMAMFVAFLYGGMIWGILPTDERISWEGHLSGLVVGAFLAWYFVEKGPVAPKYQYEIEKELGIEPPDLEGMYWAKVREFEEQQQRLKEEQDLQLQTSREQQTEAGQEIKVVYTYTRNKSNDRPDGSAQ